MNRLHGIVEGVESDGEVSFVTVRIEEALISSLVLDSGSSADYLQPGRAVTVMFKESELSLAIGEEPRISIRNRFDCVLSELKVGGMLAHVVLEFGNRPLQALISSSAARELGLAAGCRVYALVKSTDVSLAEGHVGG